MVALLAFEEVCKSAPVALCTACASVATLLGSLVYACVAVAMRYVSLAEAREPIIWESERE